MANEIVFAVEEAPEGGYTASSVGDGYAIFTEGDDLEELREMVHDAVMCSFENELELPTQIRLHFVRDEVIPVDKTRPPFVRSETR